MGNCWYFGGPWASKCGPETGGSWEGFGGSQGGKEGESYAIKAIIMQAKGFWLISHSICPSPIFCVSDSLSLVDFPKFCHVICKRIIRIGSRKQSLDGQQNSPNLKCWTPFIYKKEEKYIKLANILWKPTNFLKKCNDVQFQQSWMDNKTVLIWTGLHISCFV